MLLCENGELKLASGSVGEELSLLPEERTGEGGQRLGVQKSRRCWDIGPTGDNRCQQVLGAGEMEQGEDPSSEFLFSPRSPASASSLCFNLDTDQPTVFLMDSAGFGHSVVQYGNTW